MWSWHHSLLSIQPVKKQLEWLLCKGSYSDSQTIHLWTNVNKCCVMDIVTNKSLSLSPIFISLSEQIIVKQVNSLTFLGVTFASDVKWNAHVSKIIKKASKHIFVIRNLRRGGCPSLLIWWSYVALIRSVLLLYAFPCFCNAPNFLIDKLFRVEKRVRRIINDDTVCVPSLKLAADTLGVRLFLKVLKDEQHPLRSFFDQCGARCTRSSRDIRRPFAKTKRFSTSFIIFCR